MTWFFIILNLYGGEPTFIEMPTKDACHAAVNASPVGPALTWCIPAGEWPVTPE